MYRVTAKPLRGALKFEINKISYYLVIYRRAAIRLVLSNGILKVYNTYIGILCVSSRAHIYNRIIVVFDPARFPLSRR